MLAACLLLNGIQAVAMTFSTTIIFESIDILHICWCFMAILSADRARTKCTRIH